MNRTKTRLALFVASICLCTVAWAAENVNFDTSGLTEITSLLKNPDFENGTTGWTIIGNGNTISTASQHGYNGTSFMEHWVSSGSELNDLNWYQTISVPNGCYIIKVLAHAIQQSDASIIPQGVIIYANSDQCNVVSTKSEEYILITTVYDNSITIGFCTQSTNVNWAAWDNIQLFQSSEEQLKSQVIDNLNTLKTDASKLNNPIIQMVLIPSIEETTTELNSNSITIEEGLNLYAKYKKQYLLYENLYAKIEEAKAEGYYVEKFETIFSNTESTDQDIVEALEMLTNALGISNQYILPEWSDYPLLLEDTKDNSWSVSGSDIILQKGTVNITTTLRITQNSTLVYDYDAFNYYNQFESKCLSVYIDGTLVRTINESRHQGNRYFEKLSPGVHNITWEYESLHHSAKLSQIGIAHTPSIEVDLLEPGSLGTEILYYVNHVRDVRQLKIRGEMNGDDWSKINMMTNLFSLDLSEANISEITPKQFSREGYRWEFLHEIELPEGLVSIGDEAFYDSRINKLAFPSTIKSIGYKAFERSMIEEAVMPDEITSIGGSVFEGCSHLKKVHYPQSMIYIPPHAFRGCSNLENIQLHEGLNNIGSLAFADTRYVNPRFPKSLQSIEDNAYENAAAIDSLFIHDGIYLGNNVFGGCWNIKYAEFPTTYYQNNIEVSSHSHSPIYGCTGLNTVVLKSPTVVQGKYKDHFLAMCPSNVTIVVPSFLVNSYKLDEYWYNYNIEGFETKELKYWEIRKPLTLGAKERFEGNPNIKIAGEGSLKIQGTTMMDIDTLQVDGHGDNEAYSTKLIVNNNAVKINGGLELWYWTSAHKWYFISLPFNTTIKSIINNANAKYAIRYYDGGNRAINGVGNNWRDYNLNDTILAGAGFIYQTSKDCWNKFTSIDDEKKQRIVSNEELIKELQANPSEIISNSGWNLVGNPWQCYFNIHTLNFTAPITVYDVSKKTYTAYSIIDDDYAIRPNEAFFVQCPEGTEYISFPETGRQLTSEITNQSSAPAKRTAAMGSRQLVDVAISAGDLTDKTRVVLNEAALMEYETACDASKFFTMDAGVPQIYTLDSEATEYAINERPVGNGNVQLGVVIAASGKHTISMPRNDAKTVVLIDHVAGTTHDLSLGEYTFTAEAGTYNGRFTLSISKAHTTAIDEATATDFTVKSVENAIVVSGAEGMVTVFTIDGRKVAEQESKGSVTFGNLPEGSYLVRTVNGTSKVTVK